ncbi:MAG: ribonuclease HI [Acetobacter sp.]|nr:ribonuclease HI [Acetobacter sp.]
MDCNNLSVSQGSDVGEIWTDGGCKPNPGPGGWGVLLRYRGKERELSGGEKQTTNNRMELTAVAKALEVLRRPCFIKIYTDSEYVCKGMTEWCDVWLSRGWRKSSGGSLILNVDLWRRVFELSVCHDVSWHWVKGHSGVIENERVDELARRAREVVEREL